MAALKDQLTADMKATMREKDSRKLTVIRLMLSAIKQVEVDERITLDDEQILTLLDKMVKQRRDSIKQFNAAGRSELSEQEEYEIGIIQTYLPEQLTESEIESLIKEAIASSSAESMKDMGKVMGILKPKLQGRADMGQVSDKIKKLLG